MLRTWVEPQLACAAGLHFALIENRLARPESREGNSVCGARIMSKRAAPGTFSVGACFPLSGEGAEGGVEGGVEGGIEDPP